MIDWLELKPEEIEVMIPLNDLFIWASIKWGKDWIKWNLYFITKVLWSIFRFLIQVRRKEGLNRLTK